MCAKALVCQERVNVFSLLILDICWHISNWKLIKLQNKAQAIEPYLNGRCIYLVGKSLRTPFVFNLGFFFTLYLKKLILNCRYDGIWENDCWQDFVASN